MKVCAKCKETKYKTQFNKYRKSLNSYCKSCVCALNKQLKKEQKQKAIKYKGGVCSDCGGVFSPSVFNFHHLDPKNKKFNIDRSLRWERTKIELDKCVLLCANCHITRHADERQGASQCR